MQKVHAKNLLDHYLSGLVDGKFTLKQASESTGYSIRHLSHLKKLYQEQGSLCLLSRNKGRIPGNKISHDVREKVAQIYAQERYQDVNFKFFQECLEEFEDIKISYPTLRSIMNEYGLKSPEAHKVKKKISAHRPRVRRDHEGDLIQIDGTPFEWFYKFGDTNKYCLTGAIDDATGKITGLYMTQNECLFGYLEILRETCLNFGIPREIYSDRSACFIKTRKSYNNPSADFTLYEQLSGDSRSKTQWQRILGELNIRQILAWSPQAKGRIERLWGTLQGRLPTEFYLHKIDSMEKANLYLKKYIKKFNEQFARKPYSEKPFWRSIDAETLDRTLVVKFQRRVRNAAIQFHSMTMEVVGWRSGRQTTGTLCLSEKGVSILMPDDLYYDLKLIDYDEVDDSNLNIIDPHISGPVDRVIHKYLYTFNKEVSI